MRGKFRYSIALFFILLFAYAFQRRGHRGPWLFYNPKTVRTIAGTISHVNYSGSFCGRDRFLVLELNAKKKKYKVFVGPICFVDYKFKPGESVRITGSVIEIKETAYVIPREITVQDKTIKLRDEMGFPLWRTSRFGCRERWTKGRK